MKEELLVPILESMREIKPRKAKKLEKLIKIYEEATDKEQKKQARRKIYNCIYQIFSNLVSSKTRQQLSDLNSSIGEECYQIEQNEKGAWIIGYEGAIRRERHGDELVVTNVIPREYQKGFYLSEEQQTSTEAKKREINFFKKYRMNLERISSMMDQKMEIHSGDFQLKNDNVDRQFVELLIDFLELKTIEKEQTKTYQK